MLAWRLPYQPTHVMLIGAGILNGTHGWELLSPERNLHNIVGFRGNRMKIKLYRTTKLLRVDAVKNLKGQKSKPGDTRDSHNTERQIDSDNHAGAHLLLGVVSGQGVLVLLLGGCCLSSASS
ncbi:hypothetical protein E2C01_101126 [Portunus trituberculatus]|uniref:Uncharacterized protein n=1 Tax=Portunus trituberculatus TaxID=210409 RepID=A0A5B7KEU2_PORTR|nr:hypothetical protein [Portunus trituberculatus]